MTKCPLHLAIRCHTDMNGMEELKCTHEQEKTAEMEHPKIPCNYFASLVLYLHGLAV